MNAEITTGRRKSETKKKPTSTERVIRAGGVEIATEAFGNPANPPILLMMGMMASMLWWPAEFCQRLAEQKRYVIRYDNRDTGLSTAYEPGEPTYTLDDMTDDVFRVLDGYGIRTANVVGMSLGGVIAQYAALKHPRRVASLTAISTWPVGSDTSHPPESTETDVDPSAGGEKVDWSDRAQVIDFMVKDARMLAGTTHCHDERDARQLIERDYDRAKNFASATNHFMLKGGDQWKGRLREIRAPLLVIHGTADPAVPVEHGAALADAFADAKFVRLEGGGHELHREDWDEIIAAIVEHTNPRS
ncbi:alpha/beta fold hydrolase [Allomesorhizobium camelthorni]|uniref:Alpha/beta hydrolase n=1 Tax=Allomesorhizobium camelthorni TaxID=475069 RepID=A0A6G4WEB3_9HYPH|nr:alpha/beta hydrolase [Mesorhizobium camelthorni]NGO52533.1 alpha/beta hydrolase [Mesorhizobium camelthorni]